MIVIHPQSKLVNSYFNYFQYFINSWWQDRLRNGNVSDYCNSPNQTRLVFGLTDQDYIKETIISSRSLLTETFNLSAFNQCMIAYAPEELCLLNFLSATTINPEKPSSPIAPTTSFSSDISPYLMSSIIETSMEPTTSFHTISPQLTTSHTLTPSTINVLDEPSSTVNLALSMTSDYVISESEPDLEPTFSNIQPSPPSHIYTTLVNQNTQAIQNSMPNSYLSKHHPLTVYPSPSVILEHSVSTSVMPINSLPTSKEVRGDNIESLPDIQYLNALEEITRNKVRIYCTIYF